MEQDKDNYLRLPDLGEVDEVTIVEWLKGEGESFSLGDDLVEVETEKTTFIVDAPATGEWFVSPARKERRHASVIRWRS